MNSAGKTAIDYLKHALEMAERNQWMAVEHNAKEAAKYAKTAQAIDRVSHS